MNQYSQDIINKLKELEPILRKEFGIKRLRVFGSVARGEAEPGSDVDLIADFGSDLNYDDFFDARENIENSLDTPIDFLTSDSINAYIKPYIDQNIQDIYS